MSMECSNILVCSSQVMMQLYNIGGWVNVIPIANSTENDASVDLAVVIWQTT